MPSAAKFPWRVLGLLRPGLWPRRRRGRREVQTAGRADTRARRRAPAAVDKLLVEVVAQQKDLRADLRRVAGQSSKALVLAA